MSDSRSLHRPARLTAFVLAAGLVVTGCSSGDDEPEATTSPSASATTESPTGDVSLPAGVELTAQGTDLSFGDTATVVFEPDQKTSTILDLTVTGAREGKLDDFKGFVLDDKYTRQANYYYVDVTVENVGEENVGGEPVPLWGVNGENTLLPAVSFRSSFAKCESTPLPKKFPPGKSVDTCLVYLSPDKGALESLSFRPEQSFDPIEWTGEVKPPKADKDKKPGKKNKKSKKKSKNDG